MAVERYLASVITDLRVVRCERVANLVRSGTLWSQETLHGGPLALDGTAALVPPEMLDNFAPEPEDELLQEARAAAFEQELHEKVQRFLQGPKSDDPSLAVNIGIELEALPAVEDLDDRQVTQLANELRLVMACYGHFDYAPKHYPRRLLYPMLLDRLRLPGRTYLDGGRLYDGCDGSGIDCVWGEWCSCAQTLRKEE